MAFELMICRGLHCGAKLMTIDIEPLSACPPDEFGSRPRIDLKFDEDESIGVEEEKDFVQPVDDLCGFIPASRLEITFFQRTEWSRIYKDTDQTLRRRDERFFACLTARKDTDVGSVFEKLKH